MEKAAIVYIIGYILLYILFRYNSGIDGRTYRDIAVRLLVSLMSWVGVVLWLFFAAIYSDIWKKDGPKWL